VLHTASRRGHGDDSIYYYHRVGTECSDARYHRTCSGRGRGVRSLGQAPDGTRLRRKAWSSCRPRGSRISGRTIAGSRLERTDTASAASVSGMARLASAMNVGTALARGASSAPAALAVTRLIQARTGWAIKRFVCTARRYRAIEVSAGQQFLTAEDPFPPTYATSSPDPGGLAMRTN
jgi:hypothetical protein